MAAPSGCACYLFFACLIACLIVCLFACLFVCKFVCWLLCLLADFVLKFLFFLTWEIVAYTMYIIHLDSIWENVRKRSVKKTSQ